VKLVLDTNAWLDWLVFGDPRIAPLRAAVEAKRAEVVIDEACEAELARVLTYRFYKEFLPLEIREAHLAQCRRVASKVAFETAKQPMPRCQDPDDQKFLALAAAAGADCLVTRDRELLRLAKRVPFRILVPEALET
jgi:putative PIN family toxin of toxin-antitoxin system